MITIRKILPFILLPIITFKVSILASCSRNDIDMHLFMDAEVRDYDGCRDYRFLWFNQRLTPGLELGHGTFGTVYPLYNDGGVDSGLVLKAIVRQSEEHVRRLVNEEVILADTLPGLYPSTQVRGIFRLKDLNQGFQHIGQLIKKRVNGPTLAQFLAQDFEPESIIISQALASLRDFRATLIDRLEEISWQGSYIWDISKDNLMFDVQKDQWYLVDAKLISSWREFQRFIDTGSFLPEDVQGSQIKHFIEIHRNSLPQERSQFFELYVDYHLKEAIDRIEAFHQSI